MNFLLNNFLSENVVDDLMKTDVPTIDINSTIKDAANIMFDNQVTHLPVVDENDKLLGIVTAWDLSKSIAKDCKLLEDVMTKDVRYCKSTDSIEYISRQMKKFDISCLPVVNDDLCLEGIITTDQISHLISSY